MSAGEKAEWLQVLDLMSDGQLTRFTRLLQTATEQEDLADNKKTAQLRAVSGSQSVTESSALTSVNSISDAENLSSGGPDGNRTRETPMSKRSSSPDQAHLEPLYHKPVNPVKSGFAGSPPAKFNRVNIQDLLNKRESGGQAGLGGLPMAGGKNQESRVKNQQENQKQGQQNKSSGITPPIQSSVKEQKFDLSAPSGHLSTPGEKNNEESIDKKLEDLKKKLKI